MTFDVYIVGQIVRDINYLSKVDSRVQTFGGTAFYSGVTYNSLGLTTAVHTSFDVHDKPLLANYGFDKKIVLFNQEGSTTTEFNNYYSEKSKNVRFQKMKFNGFPVDGELRNSKIYHFLSSMVVNALTRILHNSQLFQKLCCYTLGTQSSRERSCLTGPK